MNNKTILQIPLDVSLRDEALRAAEGLGFSSLQETVRVFLKKLANQTIGISFEEKENLSPKAERRYLQMVKGVQSGKVKVKSFKDVGEMMNFLNS